MITETATPDNTIPLALVRAGREIDAGFARAQRGTEDWIEGSLQLAQGLALGRKEFPADKAFGVWLAENNHDHVSHQDRAALIGMASDIDLARDVLTQTNRRSYRLIWVESKDRFTSAGKPRAPKLPKAPKAPAEDKLRTFAQEFETRHGRPPKDIECRKEGFTSGVTQKVLAKLDGERKVDTAEEQLEARVQARIESDLAKTAKDRLEALVAAHKRKLDAEYEDRRRADVDRIVEEKIKPYYRKQVEDYARVIKARRGVLTYGEYEFLLRTLHPDVVARFNDAEFSVRCNTCMQILIEHKLVLLPEKEMVTALPPPLNDLFVPRARR